MRKPCLLYTSHHIERGYEDIVRKLSGVGADIRVVVTPDEDKQAQVG